MSIRATSDSAANPGRSRRAITRQPLAHKRAVHADQRGDVGHSGQAQRGRATPSGQGPLRLLRASGDPLRPASETQRRCAKMRQRAVFVLPVRVHDSQRLGQGFAAQVVIKHDHVGTFGGGNRTVR